jgi:hypothetical protein
MVPEVCTTGLPGVTLTLIAGGGVVVAGGFTVTLAYAFESSKAALLAVIVTDVAVVTAGAVRRPVLEIEPALVDQRTDVLLVPLTVAANCCAPPEVKVALVGFKLTVILVEEGGFTVIMAEAFASAEAVLAAVTVT